MRAPTHAQDLVGKRVGTWEDPDYMNPLERRDITAVPYRWDTDADLDKMLSDVLVG